MNTQELKDKIHELEAELKSFKSELDKELSKPKMFPQEGDTYWDYDTAGFVAECNALDSDGRVNAYRTKEEAEKARDIAFAKQRVKYAIEVANEGWYPDWSKRDDKYFIVNNTADNKLESIASTHYKQQQSYMYMKSKRMAEKILAEHRDDLELIFSE